jgi:hypothetical protein
MKKSAQEALSALKMSDSECFSDKGEVRLTSELMDQLSEVNLTRFKDYMMDLLSDEYIEEYAKKLTDFDDDTPAYISIYARSVAVDLAKKVRNKITYNNFN